MCDCSTAVAKCFAMLTKGTVEKDCFTKCLTLELKIDGYMVLKAVSYTAIMLGNFDP